MYRKITIIACLTTLLITSCAKLSDNGLLDGKWQLTEMYSKKDASEQTFKLFESKSDQKIYWIFQLNLLNIINQTTLSADSCDFMARFNHVDDHLNITETYIHFRAEDSLITDPQTEIMKSVGIRGNSARFIVKDLNSRHMILCSEHDSLVFKKK